MVARLVSSAKPCGNERESNKSLGLTRRGSSEGSGLGLGAGRFVWLSGDHGGSGRAIGWGRAKMEVVGSMSSHVMLKRCNR